MTLSEIFISQEQQDLINAFDTNNIIKKNAERELNNEKKPWKFKSEAFIDCDYHCYFVNGQPSRLEYCGHNLGNFSLQKMKGIQISRQIPDVKKINDYIELHKLKNYCLVVGPWSSDGCCTGSTARLKYEISETFSEYE